MKKFPMLSLLMVATLLTSYPAPVLGEDTAASAGDDSVAEVEVTADDTGLSGEAINSATAEETEKVETTGTMIEIGNTTAEETTVVVRVPDGQGGTTDETLQISKATGLTNDAGQKTGLDDWIAGDQLTFSAIKNKNSGEYIASRIKNRAMKKGFKGANGWIKEIRADKNEVDVIYGKVIYTLDVSAAKMVAGLKNPAAITDLLAGDRIRARIIEDNDGNGLTWDAKTLVVLRRGKTLFMKVSRWVVPGKIVSLPDDLSAADGVMVIEILPNKFYQKGDVNNLIGEPGEKLEVLINNKTQLRRRFMGKCLLGEFTEGDTVQVLGRLNEITGQLDAKMIRDNSIQKLGVATRVAKINSVNTANNTLTAVYGNSKKEFIVTLAKDGKVYERTATSSEDLKTVTLKTINFSDLISGRRIRIRGVANKRNAAIAAQTIVMLPEQVVADGNQNADSNTQENSDNSNSSQ
ncbi:MAG: hypothetical protein WCW25_05230 [Patescibacteria group bacterium]|jgi:hypothetical protein